ncbi:MAG: hypothetical protein JOY59_14020 [Candidatus Eremiobacteraeota bacterium]|nr:hypothetical protein [Candidatus Eremiobacteraeota bacterium]
MIATRDDHIAPWRSVYAMTQILPGPVIFRLANSGHIAGIINPPGSKKAEYFANDQNPPDPEEWLRAATTRSGSWWPDWYEWLGARSGERVAPPGLPKKYSSLGPAPGTYVLEK